LGACLERYANTRFEWDLAKVVSMSIDAGRNLHELNADKAALERLFTDELAKFTEKWPSFRVCVLHEWADLRRVGEVPPQQAGHSIRVQVSL
jgi:hypothetical protein